MPKISEEEIRSLELRIQMEVKKIFAEFLEDLERKNADTEPAELQEQEISGQLPEPVKPVPAQREPNKRRASRKSTEMGRLLTGPARVGLKSSTKILEEDIDKIFRKRYRKETS